jgi:hypothetical protein
VLAVQTFRTVDEVIQKANNTPYGLSAGVWTDKGSKIFNLTTKLRAGVVWANTYNKFDPTSPFRRRTRMNERKLVIEVKDSKAEFLMELLRSLSFVKSAAISGEKDAVLESVRTAVEEMKLVKAGKLKRHSSTISTPPHPSAATRKAATAGKEGCMGWGRI